MLDFLVRRDSVLRPLQKRFRSANAALEGQPARGWHCGLAGVELFAQLLQVGFECSFKGFKDVERCRGSDGLLAESEAKQNYLQARLKVLPGDRRPNPFLQFCDPLRSQAIDLAASQARTFFDGPADESLTLETAQGGIDGARAVAVGLHGRGREDLAEVVSRRRFLLEKAEKGITERGDFKGR